MSLHDKNFAMWSIAVSALLAFIACWYQITNKAEANQPMPVCTMKVETKMHTDNDRLKSKAKAFVCGSMCA